MARKYTKRDHTPRFCKCGCGNSISIRSLQGWAAGHNSNKNMSGFLAATKRKHAAAVLSRGERKLCQCGCGELATLGRKWVYRHVKNSLTREQALAAGKKAAATRKARGYVWSDERRAAHKLMLSSDEYRNKVSAGLRRHMDTPTPARLAWFDRMAAKGFGGSKYVRGNFYSVKMQETFHYDSSWELVRLAALEASSDVLSFCRLPARIMYRANPVTDDGRNHWYYPDFGIEMRDGTYVIEEIKPLTQLAYKRNPLKSKAGERYCKLKGYQYRVITSLEDCKVISR